MDGRMLQLLVEGHGGLLVACEKPKDYCCKVSWFNPSLCVLLLV